MDNTKSVVSYAPPFSFCSPHLQSPDPPSALLELFEDLRLLGQPVPLLKSLPTLEPAILVALAGCLLEYPAIYVPSPDLCVDAVDLMLWRVLLIGVEEHTLLQFTYPACLVEDVAFLQPDVLLARLKSIFEARLRRVNSEWTTVRVECDFVTSSLIRL